MSRDKLLELAGTTDYFRASTEVHLIVMGGARWTVTLKLASDLRARGLSCWIMESQMGQTEAGSIVDRKNRELFLVRASTRRGLCLCL